MSISAAPLPETAALPALPALPVRWLVGRAVRTVRAVRDAWAGPAEPRGDVRALMGYCVSAFATWVVDYLLVLALTATTGLLVAVVAARTASCLLCFMLNRRVFDAAHAPVGPSARRYALLSAGVLAGSYLGLTVLGGLGVGTAVAKIVVDGMLFVVDYIVQKRWVHVPAPGSRGAARIG